ncbi:arginine--tRNA ligase [Candidatus Pacearchaeota archaeon]|nr:arginine--tRNA ligase [Candidatus Pacearchaeota archaeon]
MKSEVISALKVTGLDEKSITDLIEIPKESSHGDYSFPCFVLSKKLKKNPVEIAREIASKIKSKEFEKVEAVGPYVNFFLDSKKNASDILQKIIKMKDKYGSSDVGKGKKFMIEFSQPNTHKAFHVGHIRGTSLGESIARIREFSGYKVTRVNYSGDTGMHIAKWLWAYLKFHKGEEIRDDESWFANIYVEAVQKLKDNESGEMEVAEINKKLDEKKDSKLIKLWKDTRSKSISAWKPIYKDLDVKFNKHFFESQTESAGKKIANELVKNGLAIISDGATIMDLKKYNLGVWVLLRNDRTVLYSAKDLELARNKFLNYKMGESLVITAAEQNLHFKQLQKTLELMNFKNWEKYNHLGFESVRLPEGKMSSRTGKNILYADFRNELVQAAKEEILKRDNIDEKELNARALAIAVSAIKYSMLKQDTNKVIIFNKEESIKFEGDTGPYLLYSYARANSILDKAKYKASAKIKIDSININERTLINELSRFPDLVVEASKFLSPSGIAHYSYNLAQTFNEFYHSCPVLGSAEERFRLCLVSCFIQVLGNALKLLGIPVLKEM